MGKLAIRRQRVNDCTARIKARLAQAESGEAPLPLAHVNWLKQRLPKMKDDLLRLDEIEKRLKLAPDKQLALTDPDARVMNSRGHAMVGYNGQIAVEPGHHFIVYHDVVTTASDRHQLAKMSLIARAFLKAKQLNVLADRGYYKGEEILLCEELGITTFVPRCHTSGNEAAGFYSRESFRYVPEHDEYRCPANEHLIRRHRIIQDGKVMRAYWSSACPTCPLKSRCTKGKNRRIYRWEHEAVLDKVQERVYRNPRAMELRRSTVEHPFGTLKIWMGYNHFQTRGLKQVKTEFSLHVLAYNLRRAINLLGVTALVKKLNKKINLKIRVLCRLFLPAPATCAALLSSFLVVEVPACIKLLFFVFTTQAVPIAAARRFACSESERIYTGRSF